MAAIYDALGNYIGDDGSPEPGALMQPPPVAPVAGTAPLAGTAAPVAPAIPPMPQPALEQPTDVMGYSLPEGVLGPSTYDEPMMGEGVLMAANAPEGVLMAPEQDTGLFSFLNKPGASDSLVAFGSAMLRAPTFGEGLANAADAVTQVAQQYREPTPREISLAQMRGKLARAASGKTDVNGYEWDLKNRIVGNDGKTYYPGIGPDGMPSFYNIDTKQVVSNVPGGTSDTYSALAQQNRKTGLETGDQISSFAIQVQAAPSKIADYDRMSAMIDTTGFGGDVFNQMFGKFSELSGFDVAGIDLSDRKVMQQQMARMNLASSEALRGQGQVTEAERDLLAKTNITLDMTPEAAKRVLAILKKAEERKIDQWMKYQELKSRGINVDWTTFVLDYRMKLDAAEGNLAASPGEASGTTGEKPSLESIFNQN